MALHKETKKLQPFSPFVSLFYKLSRVDINPVHRINSGIDILVVINDIQFKINRTVCEYYFLNARPSTAVQRA